MAVSKRLRYEILRRDDHTCRYCGACRYFCGAAWRTIRERHDLASALITEEVV